MAVLQVIGPTTPCQQGTVKHFTFFEGEKQFLVFKGQREQVDALYQSYLNIAGFVPTYDDIQFDPGKGLATLTLTILGDGSPIYELSANELSSPIETDPYFAALTSPQILAVKQGIQTPGFDPASASPEWVALQNTLFYNIIHGGEEYPVSQYVLRETKNVSKRSTVTASFANVNKVDTPPNVAAANTLIGSIPSQEWLKKTPVVRQIGNQRWQIITEWWGALKWSSILYGGSLTYSS